MKRLIAILTLALLLMPYPMARADALDFFESDDQIYQLVNEQGQYITSRAGRIYEGDEYISGDNQLYRVITVDDAAHSATAQHVGAEPDLTANEATQVAALVNASAATAKPDAKESANEADGKGKKLICMYSTHSDESYIKGDGTQSKEGHGGIYDIGDDLKANLEKLGWTVEYSKETSLPHDAGAYRRSRQIAEDFIKQQPTALLDIHRDGIPNESEYTTTVDGEDMTQVRLFVGRNNPNASANRSLAKKLKADADKQYPDFIKDIFIGKGNYNQELYPQSLLLEFGTHTSEKDHVEKSTKVMADVLDNVLGSGTAKAEGAEGAAGAKTQNASGATGIAWIVGIAIVGAAIYGLVSTGTLGNWKEKLARGSSEVTGGLIGKQRDDERDKDGHK